MIRVPAISIDGAILPTAKGGDEGNEGKGKKGGGGDSGGGGGGGGSSPDAGTSDSSGTASVLVRAFWLDATEVTAGAYRACITRGACPPPATAEGCTVHANLAAHPASCVTLEEARSYCRFVQKRLPTSAEWSAAAAGAAKRTYPWGEDSPSADRLDACGAECSDHPMFAGSDGHPKTAPVGTFALGRSPEGAFDLSGNVAEWTESPLGAVVRGGSWEDVDVRAVASAAAIAIAPDEKRPTIGFRCAADD